MIPEKNVKLIIQQNKAIEEFLIRFKYYSFKISEKGKLERRSYML
jgi:hypothetical protein